MWLKWLGLSIVFLIALLQVLSWAFLDSFLENALKTRVLQDSQGRYALENLQVDTDVIRGNITLRNVHLRVQSLGSRKISLANDTVPGLRNAFFSEISFSGINALAIYRRKRLHLAQVYVHRPLLELWNQSHASQPGEEQKPPPAPFTLLPDFLQSLSISEILVKEGEVRFLNQEGTHAIKNIDLQINSFRLDSLADAWAKVIPGVVIELGENDYSFLFPNSGSLTQSKSLSYHTRTRVLQIQGLQHAPDYGQAGTGTATPMRVELAVEEIDIGGLDWSELLSRTVQKVEYLTVTEPQVRLFSAQKPSGDKPSGKRAVPPILQGVLIDRIEVRNGDLTWFRGLQDSVGDATARQIDVDARRVSLDSLLAGEAGKWIRQSQVAVKIGTYRLAMPLRGYLLTGKTLDYAADKDQLLTKEVSWVPLRKVMGPSQSSAISEMHIPEVEIHGWDPTTMGTNRARKWSQVVLRDPTILVSGLMEPQEKPDRRQNRAWQIEHFQIENGTITTDESAPGEAGRHEFAATQVNLNAQHLDIGAAVRHAGLMQVDARTLHYDFQIDSYRYLAPDSSFQLELGNVVVSDRDSLIQGTTAHLRIAPDPVSASDTTGLQYLSAAVADWQLAGFRPLELLRNRQLQASRLTLRTPDLRVESTAAKRVTLDSVLDRKSDWKILYPLIKDNLTAIVLGELEIESGHLLTLRTKAGEVGRMEFPEYDLRLGDIRIDSARQVDHDKPFYFSDIFFALKDYTIAFGDSIHQLSVGKMGISSLAQLVYFSDIELRRDSLVLERPRLAKLPNLYQARIPLITLEQVDLFESIKTRRLEVAEIYIHGPAGQLNSFPEFQEAIIDSLDSYEGFERPDLYDPISGLLDALVVKKFRLSEGTFFLNNQSESAENGFTARNISVDIQNFVIDSAAQRRTDRYFYADSMNVGINVRDYTFMTPDSAYMLTVGNIGVMSATEQIYADSIYLLPRLEQIQPDDSSTARLKVFVPRVALEGMNIKKAYFDKKITARKLEIQRPELTQYGGESNTALTWNRDSLHKKLYETLLKNYQSIRLAEIDLKGGKWKQIHTNRGDSTLRATYTGLFAQARDFALDEDVAHQNPPMLFANNWSLGARNYRVRTADSLYFFEVKKATLETGFRELRLDTVRLIPRYPRYEFAAQKGEWVDRVDLQIRKMLMERLDVDSLLFGQRLIAGRLDVSGLRVSVFKDKRLTEPEELNPPLLVDQLRQIPIPVHVDTLNVANSFVEYAEQVPEAEGPGVFQLTNLSARIHPFSNDPTVLRSNTIMYISSRSRVMDSGIMRLRFQYPLNDPAGRFHFEGEIDSMDLVDFNPMIANTAFFQVNSGQLRQMYFYIDADRQLARGKMRFFYNDLNITFLGNKKKDDDNAMDPRRFASFLANAFVVKSDNPTRRFLRVGKIYFERNERRSIFNYWAHAALSGVKASIGATKGKDKDKTAGWSRFQNAN